MTSTNLEDDRNNNLIADKSEVEGVNNDDDEMVSSGPDSPHSPPQRRPSSPSLVYRKAPPPELEAVAPGVPLDYSVSSVATTAAQSAEAAQENVYESVAKVREIKTCFFTSIFVQYCGGSCHSIYIYIHYTCLANYGASEAVNLCSRYVKKSTKCSELKCASSLREKKSVVV